MYRAQVQTTTMKTPNDKPLTPQKVKSQKPKANASSNNLLSNHAKLKRSQVNEANTSTVTRQDTANNNASQQLIFIIATYSANTNRLKYLHFS